VVAQHQGSCYCGSVKYKINSDFKNIVNCHCKLCRSHSGTSLSTYAVFPYAAFEIINPDDVLKQHKLGQAIKHFCSNCGTPVFNLNSKYPGACMVYIGTLEDFDENPPQVNIWCESKLNWLDEIAEIHSIKQGI
jgi:hypothetical protein